MWGGWPYLYTFVLVLLFRNRFAPTARTPNSITDLPQKKKQKSPDGRVAWHEFWQSGVSHPAVDSLFSHWGSEKPCKVFQGCRVSPGFRFNALGPWVRGFLGSQSPAARSNLSRLFEVCFQISAGSHSCRSECLCRMAVLGFSAF